MDKSIKIWCILHERNTALEFVHSGNIAKKLVKKLAAHFAGNNVFSSAHFWETRLRAFKV